MLEPRLAREAFPSFNVFLFPEKRSVRYYVTLEMYVTLASIMDCHPGYERHDRREGRQTCTVKPKWRPTILQEMIKVLCGSSRSRRAYVWMYLCYMDGMGKALACDGTTSRVHIRSFQSQ